MLTILRDTKTNFRFPRNKNKVLKNRYELLWTEVPLITDVMSRFNFPLRGCYADAKGFVYSIWFHLNLFDHIYWIALPFLENPGKVIQIILRNFIFSDSRLRLIFGKFIIRILWVSLQFFQSIGSWAWPISGKLIQLEWFDRMNFPDVSLGHSPKFSNRRLDELSRYLSWSWPNFEKNLNRYSWNFNGWAFQELVFSPEICQ